MSNSRYRFSRSNLRYAIGVAACLGAIPFSQAQSITFTSDQVTVSADSGFGGATPAISDDGIIDEVNNLPSASADPFPTFSLDLVGADIPDGAYKFRAGFIMIDANGASRRLEISVPSLTINFTSNNAVLTLGAGTATVLAREDTGTVEASGTIPNALFTGSGNTLTLDLDAQLGDIDGLGGIFSDVIGSIDSVAPDYRYHVYLRQLRQSNSEAEITFGTSTPATFPCAPGDAFILNSAQFAADFAGAYALQGRLGFNGSTPGLAAPTAFSTTCATDDSQIPSSGGGGGGGGGGSTTTTSSTVTTASETLSALTDLSNPSSSTVSLVNDAVTDASSLGNSVATDLLQGNASPADALSAVSTLNDAMGLGARLNDEGDTAQPTEDLVNLVQSTGNIINSIANASTPITTAQLATLVSSVTTFTLNLASNVADNLPSQEAESLANALSSVLQATAALGGSIDATLKQSVQSVADNLVSSSASEILERFTSGGTDIKEEASKSPLVARGVLNTSVVLLQSTVEDSEVSAVSFPIADYQAIITNIAGAPVGGGLRRALDSSSPVADFLADAIGRGTVVAIDEDTGLVEITSGGARFATKTLRVNIVPDAMPEGVTLLPDGTAVIVDDGIGHLAAPDSRNLAQFTSALSSGFSATVTANTTSGSYVLEADGLKASVTFAFDGYSDSAANATGAVTLVDPSSTNPAEPGFAFSVQYSDGISQLLAPYPVADDLLDSLALTGVDASIDRTTGVIDMGDGLYLKTDYFVSEPTASQAAFLNNSGDEFGNAISSGADLNGDGVTDFRVVSEDGVQILWGVP